MPLRSTSTFVAFDDGDDKDIANGQAEEKDRQTSNNEDAKQTQEKAAEAARLKKEKKFQDIVKEPK